MLYSYLSAGQDFCQNINEISTIVLTQLLMSPSVHKAQQTPKCNSCSITQKEVVQALKVVSTISNKMVILCQMNQKNGKVNPPSQISLKFHKQIEIFMLIFFKLVKVSQSYGPYKMTNFCGQWSITTRKKINN